MNERGEQGPRERTPHPAEEEAAFIKEREPKEDGRYVIFYTFDGEEKDQKL